MDLASLKNMIANQPSLLNYLGGGNQSKALAAQRTATQQTVSRILDQVNTQSGDQVSLSPEAQALLAQYGTGDAKLTGVQRAAQAFFLGFFEDSGVDLSKASSETLEFLKGFQDVIAGSGSVQRDTITDNMEERYHKGNRDAFTLLGDNSRLRMTIDYKDDKPSKMTITDILGGNVEVATITLDGLGAANPAIIVGREQREYANGNLVESNTRMPLTLALYGA